MVCTLIDYRNDVNMLKSLQQNHSPATFWLYLTFEHFDVISMVCKRTDHGKLSSIFLQ